MTTNKDNTYELFIDVKGESHIQEGEGEALADDKMFKMLELILKKLESNKSDDLIRSRLNRRLKPPIA